MIVIILHTRKLLGIAFASVYRSNIEQNAFLIGRCQSLYLLALFSINYYYYFSIKSQIIRNYN